ELGLQIGDLRGAQADEDGQAHPARGGKRLVAGGGHADGWVRHLVRTRRDDRVVDPIELALVAERLALPSLTDDLQRLAESGLARPLTHLLDEEPEVHGPRIPPRRRAAARGRGGRRRSGPERSPARPAPGPGTRRSRTGSGDGSSSRWEARRDSPLRPAARCAASACGDRAPERRTAAPPCTDAWAR